MPICKSCKHLYDPAEPHECPSPEDIQTRNALIHDAAALEEEFGLDYLESFVRERKQNET